MKTTSRQGFRLPIEECAVPPRAVRWDPEIDGVTAGIISAFLTCREQTRLSLVLGWQRKVEPIYFAFGTCMHWLLKGAYLQKNKPSTGWFNKNLAAYQELWHKEIGRATKKQIAEQEKVYALIRAVFPAYLRHWAGDWNDGKYPHTVNFKRPRQWVALEEDFHVALEWGEVAPRVRIPVSGQRDAVFLDRLDKLWVMDTKCYSIIQPENIQASMEWDIQLLLYAWALWQEQKLKPKGKRKKIGGIMFNVVRRPGHVLRVDESLKVFTGRVTEEIWNSKDRSHFFSRFPFPLNERMLQKWETEWLRPVVLDLLAWFKGKTQHYLNPLTLITKYGRCALFDAILHNDFSDCFQRKEVFEYRNRVVD